MDVDLFIKKMPHVVKELISREAFDNRRSINQEAIALLEEALVHRVGAPVTKRKQMEALLDRYADTNPGSTSAADALGAPGSPLPPVPSASAGALS